MDVGFIGLGAMGVPMVGHLAAAGHRVLAWNRSEKDPPEGVAMVGSPAALAGSAPVVVVMVNDAQSVDEVLFAEDGWASGAKPGSLVVQMATIGPQATHALADRLTAAGLRLVDAPVSGSSQVAKAAELVVLAGADAADLAEVTPLFEAMGRRIIHAGPVGTGSALKVVVNAVLVASIAATAEALNWLEEVEPGIDSEVLSAGLERVAPLAARRVQNILLDDPPASGFRVAQVVKDLGLLGDGVPEPGVLDAVRDLYTATADGMGDRDLSAVGAYLRKEG